MRLYIRKRLVKCRVRDVSIAGNIGYVSEYDIRRYYDINRYAPHIQFYADGNDGQRYIICLNDSDICAINDARQRYRDKFFLESDRKEKA